MLLRTHYEGAPLEPEELLLAALVRQAIRDAMQTENVWLRDEALQWLWWVAPGIAERAEMQRPIVTEICQAN
jgi:hypothetical protein